MVGIPLIFTVVLAIVAMFLVLWRFRLHPFLAILGVSVVLGIVAGIPLTSIPGVLGAGFSGIFTGIGIVVIFGVLIGSVLEVSGAAIKIANMVIKLVGKRSPTLSFMIMGWIVAIPVYCDSGFVILNPIRKSLVKRTGVSGIATSVGLGTGLYVSHVLVPFTPGPLMASIMLGLADSLPLVMIVAIVVSIPALVGAFFYATYIGRKKKSREDLKVIRDDTVKSYGQLVTKYKKLPNGLLALSPIFVPLLLLVLNSVGTIAGWTGLGGDVVGFLGRPLIAMFIGLIFAVILLLATKKMKDFNPITESTLKTVGPMLCVTAAGGVLGQVIIYSNVIEFVMANTGAMHGMGLFFPFLLAAIIKTAQGSSTVAILTTAGVMAPLMAVLGLDSVMMSALTVMAIGAGSMFISHANDSYFWIIAKLSGMSPRHAYLSHTVITFIGGVCCMAGIFIFSLFVG